MQNKTPILIAAVVLGILALGGTLMMLRGPAPATAPATGTSVAAATPTPTPVPEMRYIANRDIPPRTVVTSDMLRRTEISGPKVPGAITSLEELRGLITGKRITSGDTISRDAFVPRLGRVIPANFEVPTGFRAVAIYVDADQTAAGLVDVGDRVDVISVNKWSWDTTGDQRVVGAKEFSTGRTIATNLLVLAVDKSLAAPVATPTPTPAPPGAPPADGSVAPPPSNVAPPPAGGTAPAEVRPANAAPAVPGGGKTRVLLAAPLETSAKLVAANDSGKLNIVIRNPLDADAQVAREAQEYPSRVVNVPRSSGGADAGPGTGGANNGSGGGAPRPSDMSLPPLPDVTVAGSSGNTPSPVPVPIPGDNTGSGMGGMGGGMGNMPEPAGPPTVDIMVVRGTEKTRVIVPKR